MASIGNRPSAALATLIVAITVVPLITLLWLGWRLLDQDRVLEQQQVKQRIEGAADLMVAALQQSVAATEQRLASGARDWPDGALAAVFEDEVVDVFPRERVAYLPTAPASRETPTAVFANGEDLEFRTRDVDGAIAVFRRLAASPDPNIRAGALLRLARNLHNAGQTDEALTAYAKLAEIDDATIGGVPTGLIARYARCKLLADLKRSAELQTEATALANDISGNRWQLTRPVYLLYAADATRWSGRTVTTSPAEAAADVITTLWERQAWPPRQVIETSGHHFIVLAQTTNVSTRVLVLSRRFVESQWVPRLTAIAAASGVELGLRDTTGATWYGSPEGKDVTRPASESLPLTIDAASLNPPREARDFAVRRRLLVTGLVVIVGMAIAASYLIARAVNREMAVARLQSDFVATVSHEFRTPLTSLRQFTDMLRENPALSDERRRIAYDAQSRATDRLLRLVESLLDFGRMQAGARRYHFEPRDCTDLVGAVVNDFRREAEASGHPIEFRGNGTVALSVDDEALSRAVRNLLENAVKYSPDPNPIEVAVERRDPDVVISVTDRGIGIPPQERASIFSKFQRGEQARTRGIKGTGIGLAMVEEIVRAHRGRIEVASEVGRGSTFTIVLPQQLAGAGG